jgi:hypothetical protein
VVKANRSGTVTEDAVRAGWLDIIDHHSPHVARLTEYVRITRTIHYTGQLSEHMMTPVEQGEATTREMLDDAYYRAFRRYTGD